jgi:multidrug resistance efflux pump
MKGLLTAFVIVLAVVIAISVAFNGETAGFNGITDSKEIAVTSGTPVEIRSLPVQQGEQVRRGDTLVVLDSPDLGARMGELNHQLDELGARKKARKAEIESNIRELEAQFEMNRRLTSELKSIKKDQGASEGAETENPIRMRINNLKSELQSLLSPGNPLEVQARRIEEEMKRLNGQKDGQVFTAQIDGIVGSVNFKAGEKVSPYSPILTLHSKSPSLVRGYVHEDVYSDITVGDRVLVRSLADSRSRHEGVVTGVGSRIVEYPVRLRKRPDIQIWGREVIIHVPDDNHFLMNEKVYIQVIQDGTPSFMHRLKNRLFGPLRS